MDNRKKVETLNEQLFDAISKNLFSKIEELLEEGAQLQAIKDKKTPIQLAASLEFWTCVDAILDAAPKTTSNDDYNYGSALLSALQKDCRPLARKLLSAGAKTTWYSSNEENYCLHWAIKNKNISLIAPLVKANADLNQPNKENDTPLQLAASLGFWDGVDAILKEASIHNIRLNNTDSILIEAIIADRDITVEKLLKVKVDSSWYTGSDRNHALHWAVKKNNIFIIGLLCNHNEFLSHTNKANQTPIHLAANLGYWDAVEAIAKATPTNDKDTYRYGAALLEAIQKDRIKIVEILLKAKTPITSEEHSYLHAAVNQGNPEMIKLLLQYGAKSSVTDNGKTPLELACELKKWSCAEVLLQDKNLKMKDHTNAGQAFINAIKASELEIADMLCKNGASILQHSKPDGNTSLHWAVCSANHPSSNHHVISYLLENGFNQTMVNKNNETPIELACRLGKWNCAQFLLEQEKKNHPNYNASRIEALHYQYALQYAIQQSNFTIIKLLLEQHAPCNGINSEMGNIALYYALHNNTKNSQIRETITLLLKHGADPRIRNKDEKNAVDLAAELNHPCLDLLKKNLLERKNPKESSIHPVKSYAKPTQQIEFYRETANELYLNMRQNTYSAKELPQIINRLLECHTEIIEANKLKLETLQHETQKKKRDTHFLNSTRNENPELKRTSLLITTSNILLKYPDTLISVPLLADMDFEEANDLKEMIDQKECIHQYYQNKVKPYLYDLKNKIILTSFKVTNFFGMYVDGVPKHIQAMNNHLKNLPDETKKMSISEISLIYSKVTEILSSIEDIGNRRHPTTSSFYEYATRNAEPLIFTNLVDMKIDLSNYTFTQPELMHTVKTDILAGSHISTIITNQNIGIPHNGIYPMLNNRQPHSLDDSPPSYLESITKTNKGSPQSFELKSILEHNQSGINIIPPSYGTDFSPPLIQTPTLPDEMSTATFNNSFPSVPQQSVVPFSIYSPPPTKPSSLNIQPPERRKMIAEI